MRVDGGKAITSRGQTDWYGWQYMTRKFEQEGMKSYVSYQLYADSLKPPPKNNEDALEDWVDET